MKAVSLIVVLVACLHSIETDRSVYTVPHPTIEVFHPRGLRVSIPDEHGIRLFAFHGAVNRHLDYEEAGDLSTDILKKHNGRWAYENRRLRLSTGDKINFWLYVIKDNLGYRLNDQRFTVSEISEAPPGFVTGPKKNKNTPSYLDEVLGGNAASSVDTQQPPPQNSECVCPQQPIGIVCPEQTTNNNVVANLSQENTHLHKQLSELQEDKSYFINKLQTSDVNINKLILTGLSDGNYSAVMYVETILREKLGFDNFNIVKTAILNDNNTITFELNSLEDKLLVLRKSKEKLTKSKFTIIDY